MYFEKLARPLRLSVLAMCSLFLFACDGDGPDGISDPRFENCPGPDCVLNPAPPGPAPATRNLLINASYEDGFVPGWTQNNAGFVTTDPLGENRYYTDTVPAPGAAFSRNLSQALPLNDGDNYILSFRARADVERTIVVGIGEYGGGFAAALQFPALTTEWQGFSYDLVAPGGVTATGGRVLFDIGEFAGIVDIDDISVTPTADPGNELVTEGSFTGNDLSAYNSGLPPDPATGSVATETGNDQVYTIDVLAPVAPFEFNLSQIFTITPGLTYKLTYRARTGPRPGAPPLPVPPATRTIITGLGLNEPPFTADTQTVLLRGDWRSYTAVITPGFGNANSRVLFDMGAADGPVFIDDVFVSIEP